MKNLLCLCILFIALFTACKKNETPSNSTPSQGSYNLKGRVQKGPFISGSSISLYELDKSLNQTGRAYTANLTDDQGSFSFANIKLSSPYVLLVANGYYFNEVSGLISSAPIQLNAIVDATDTAFRYVNILTHLEQARITYLVGKGSSFSGARKQANGEVLSIFMASDANNSEPDKLNITGAPDPDAALLAVSTICQGYRLEGPLMDLLSHIGIDIKTDGILNDTTLKSALINDITRIDLPTVRNNITSRYSQLGLSVKPGNFEKYIHRFIDSSNYKITQKITYPATGTGGTNILAGLDSVFSSGEYDLSATIPKGYNLKIICTTIGDTSSNTYAYFGTFTMNNVGWNITNPGNLIIAFQATGTGATVDVPVELPQPNRLQIDYYEGNVSKPTRTKIIRWQ